MSSWMITVLPTPAPPNRPVLPPLMKGSIRSMALMPVSNFGLRDQAVVFRAGTMDGHVAGDLGHGLLVNGLAHDVPNATQGFLADGHHDGMARIQDVQATDPDRRSRLMATERTRLPGRLVSDLEDDVQVARLGRVNRQRVVNRRQLIRGNSTSTTGPTIRTMRPVAPLLASTSFSKQMFSHLIPPKQQRHRRFRNLGRDSALAYRGYTIWSTC